MSAIKNLEAYIVQYQARFKNRVVVRGLAIAAALFVLTALIASQFSIASGFSDNVVWFWRLVLLLTLVSSALFLFVLPLRRLKASLASMLEEKSPDFEGRIQTFIGSPAVEENPMRGLLAEDALAVAQQNPPEKGIGKWALRLPAGIAAIFILVFLSALLVAPGLTPYSLRHLMAGWAVDDLLPPQSISVTPGDQLVRRGSNLLVRADTSGYQPSEASLFVKIGTSDWQEVSMSPLPESLEGGRSFEFTLFSVREPLIYYISAMGIRSSNHSVEVIDLPGVKNLKVTYTYPEWTGLEPETLEQGGDIDALPGTSVVLEVTTDNPLPAGELVLNGETMTMDISGETGTAGFRVEQDAEYFLAARIGSEQVRLTDDFFVRVLDDEKPEIEFESPGRDSDATNIEEIATNIQVEDDYRLENVELRYAINGGDWQVVSLSPENRSASLDHIFHLEEMTTAAIPDDLELGEVIPTQSVEMVSLAPGDLISYYAVAEDRNFEVQTDIYFIEVQPFDRRISRAEQGGGLGAGQGASEQEISQRQKEIIISTWNLIRESAELSSTSGNDANVLDQDRISDNARLLAGLQASLQEQAASLLETAQARRIDGDPRVSAFVDHMQRAIAAMTPASESLAAIDLETAIQPEQEALQHLLRADAVFSDIQLSLNQGGAGGGGGRAGQDLAEIMDLEIDFEQNQYETGSQASRESLEQETDDAMRELEELAQRQEQLAENLSRMREPTEAQQWQQEILRRDAEALRERLEQLERNAQTQQGAGAQPSQSGGAESGEQTSGDLAAEETSELNRRLESALEAMDRASEAMLSGDSDQLQQAAGEAQRQLEGAGSQFLEDQEASLQRAFSDMADRASELHRAQERMEETLLDGVQRAIASAPEGATSVINPFGWDEEQGFAESKRGMIAELQRLKEDMQLNADRVRAEAPRVARIVEQADRELKDSEIAIRMDIAANYMSRGESLYVANSESIVTRSLDSLSDNLKEAERALSGSGADESTLDRLLSGIRAGGEALREVAQANSGEQNQGSESQSASGAQTGGQAGGRPGDGEQEVGQQIQRDAGGSAATDARTSEAGTGNWGAWGSATEGPRGNAIGDAETQLDEIRADVGGLVPELRARGFSENQIADINQLVRQLQNASLNPDLENRMELNRTLALIEELQKSVETGLAGGSDRVRSESPSSIQLEYQEAVAEYYRRLSEDTEVDTKTNTLR